MTNPAPEIAAATAAEWCALTEGAALADLSVLGRLRITGADALDLLNRLTTNKLESLPLGTSRSTVVTNGNGRVVDFLHLAALSDGHLCLTSPNRAQVVIDWLDTFTFGEDISVQDVSVPTAQFALSGPRAANVLAEAGVPNVPVGQDTAVGTAVAGALVTLWRTLPGGADGFYLVTPTASADAVRQALVAAGTAPVSQAAWGAYRIANGFPVYGAEFDESANPLEARLRGAISEDKGCYTGQEVIARLLTYQKVQRRLMAVDLSGPAAPGTELTVEGERAGVLTSAAVQEDGGVIGLAVIAMKHAEAGRTLHAGMNIVAILREPVYAQSTEPTDA